MNKGIHIALVVFAVFIGNICHGQQDPMYSMYMFDKALINPAYTGSSDWAVGTIKHRQQFVGMDGSPSTQTLNFHMPISRRRIGVGVKVINDEIAVMRNLNATLFGAYHLNFAKGKLSAGLELGLYNRSINYQDLFLVELGDNAIPMGATSATVPDAGWGIYYQKKQFYAGISQHHVFPIKFDEGLGGNNQSRLYPHFNLLVGNVFSINKKWSIDPSLLMKTVQGAPMQLDINATAYYKDKIGLGLQYRTGDAFVALFRIEPIEGLRIAYAYDTTISGLSTYSGGAHEIILSYGIKLPPPPSEKEVHPRYYY